MSHKKKRNRNTLSEDYYASRLYHKNLSPETCLLGGSRAKRLWSQEMKENISASNENRINAFWEGKNQLDSEGKNIDSSYIGDEQFINHPSKKLRKGDSAKRKIAIQFIFKNTLDSPDKKYWKPKIIVQKIMEALQMTEGSQWGELSVLEASLAGKTFSDMYSKRGRKSEFLDYSE